MIFYRSSYRRIISSVLLSSYIFVAVVSLFHYHQIELSKASLLSNFNTKPVTDFEYFGGKNFICTIHQNFSLLHNVSGVEISCHSPDLQYSENITVLFTECYQSPFYLNSINLRAPPIYS
jgi:hypothetical protein